MIGTRRPGLEECDDKSASSEGLHARAAARTERETARLSRTWGDGEEFIAIRESKPCCECGRDSPYVVGRKGLYAFRVCWRHLSEEERDLLLFAMVELR